MGCATYITTRKSSADVMFRDVEALNADLRASTAGELATRKLDGEYDIVRILGGKHILFIDADEIELNYNIPVFKATLTCLNEKVISASGLVSNQPPLERPMVGWPIGA